jgi:UDP-N-acetyl-D-mannosaminuronic acid dehydrogenase
VLVVEPNISVLPSSLIDLVKKVDADDAIKQADVLLLLVDHQPFRAMKMMMAAMAADMKKKIIDTRGAWLA